MTVRFTSKIVCVLLFLAAACSSTAPKAPKTQLEIREFQTRTFATNNVKLVMKALLNVLQDDGFVVKNVNADLGLLSAAKEVHAETKLEASATLPDVGRDWKWKKNSTIDATVNVSEFGNECKVRVSFYVKSLSKSGKIRDARSVDDLDYYQKFFSMVDKGVFLQAEKL